MDAFPSYFISANNIRMHYWRRAEGRGSTLLLLHGWPEFCRTWRRLIPLLAAGFDLIAPDFRGFGDSEKPDPGPTDAMTVDVLAEDMRALLDALGLDRPVGFVSHDVGAYVTQGSRGAGRSGPPACSSSTAPTRHRPPLGRAGASQGNLVSVLPPDAVRRRPRRLLARARRNSGRAADRDADPRALGRARPDHQADWMDRLPEFFSNLEASVAPDAGHFVQMEQPQRAAEEIKRFFGRVMTR